MMILRNEFPDRKSNRYDDKSLDPQTEVKKAVIFSDYSDISTGHLHRPGHWKFSEKYYFVSVLPVKDH